MDHLAAFFLFLSLFVLLSPLPHSHPLFKQPHPLAATGSSCQSLAIGKRKQNDISDLDRSRQATVQDIVETRRREAPTVSVPRLADRDSSCSLSDQDEIRCIVLIFGIVQAKKILPPRIGVLRRTQHGTLGHNTHSWLQSIVFV